MLPCAMSSNMLEVDIFLSDPEELLEDDEDRRKLPSSPSDCTTSLAAADHFSLDCFFVNLLGKEEQDPDEALAEGGSEAELILFSVVDSVGLRVVLALLGGSSTGTTGEEEEVIAGSVEAALMGALQGESLIEQEPNSSLSVERCPVGGEDDVGVGESVSLSFKAGLEWTGEWKSVGSAEEQSAVSFDISSSISSAKTEPLFPVASRLPTPSRSPQARSDK